MKCLPIHEPNITYWCFFRPKEYLFDISHFNNNNNIFSAKIDSCKMSTQRGKLFAGLSTNRRERGKASVNVVLNDNDFKVSTLELKF